MPTDPTDPLAGLRAALYAVVVALVALLAALGLIAPDVTPRILDLAGAVIAAVALVVAWWTNPATRARRAGRHAKGA